jgi:hypothetical protein
MTDDSAVLFASAARPVMSHRRETYATACVARTGSIVTLESVDVMAVSRFERFFRLAADLDVDKNDLKRLSGFVFDEVYSLLVRAQATAKANVRDVIEPWDLPITKGLQERIHEFESIDEELRLEPFVAELPARPQLDVTLGDDAMKALPGVAGGLCVALARCMKLVDTTLVNPSSKHWERAFQIFELLM